ncbi:MAG: DUF6010 family protein [Bacteroidota bacterium]
MNASLIGISTGLIVIVFTSLLKRLDKKIIYSLILAGIGFLYVGFTWMNSDATVINILQALFFFFLAYFGIKKNIYFTIAGFFLHGIWDIVYHQFADPGLIPPHYDLFCFTIDFVMGFYLLIIQYQMDKKSNQ